MSASAKVSAEQKQELSTRGLLIKQFEQDFQSRGQLEEILDVLRNSLSQEDLLKHCTRRERFLHYAGMAKAMLNGGGFKFSELSDATLNLAEEFQLGSNFSEKTVQILRERAISEVKMLYPEDFAKIFEENTLRKLDVHSILGFATDTKRLLVSIFDVRMCSEKGTRIGKYALSNAAKELVLQLSLDKSNSIREYRERVRNHIVKKYQTEYPQGA